LGRRAYAAQDFLRLWRTEDGRAVGWDVKPYPHRQTRGQAVPGFGSFEVRFPDGHESVYFYWDDLPSRRLRPETLDRETALEKAEAVARAA
jgi:hypothetical protein